MRMITAAAFIGLATAAIAEPSHLGGTGLGFDQEIDTEKGTCSAWTSVDQEKVVDNIPLLKTLGAINRDAQASALRKRPTMLTLMIGASFAPIMTSSIFEKNPKVTECLFTINLLTQDPYGDDRKEEAFSYRFTRPLYDKVNWDKISTSNFIKITLDYKENPVIVNRIRVEDIKAGRD